MQPSVRPRPEGAEEKELPRSAAPPEATRSDCFQEGQQSELVEKTDVGATRDALPCRPLVHAKEAEEGRKLSGSTEILGTRYRRNTESGGIRPDQDCGCAGISLIYFIIHLMSWT
jgi:hypothetical protein